MTRATRILGLATAAAFVGCAGEPPKLAEVPLPEISIGAEDFAFTARG